MKTRISRLTLDSDLESVVSQINASKWDDANDLDEYAVGPLRAYLASEGSVFFTCHGVDAGRQNLMGIASGRIELKPYGYFKWMYVDEVDVCVDQRKKGAGKALMNALLEYAAECGCEELWLGTEVDNAPANALYRSLAPDEADEFVGYNFELKQRKND